MSQLPRDPPDSKVDFDSDRFRNEAKKLRLAIKQTLNSSCEAQTSSKGFTLADLFKVTTHQTTPVTMTRNSNHRTKYHL